MSNLTQLSIERAATPAKGQRFYRDGKVKGLALRVTANGAKSFVWEGRRGKAKYRKTLGQHPALALDGARQAALEINTAFGKGCDPFAERKAAQDRASAEWTFGDLAREFFLRPAVGKKHKRDRAQGTVRNYRNDLKNHVPLEWRPRKLSDFVHEEFEQLHSDIGKGGNKTVNNRERKSGGKYAANRTLVLLRLMFNHAKKWGHLSGDNPVDGMDLFPETKRERAYSAEELSALGKQLAEEPVHWRGYFYLTLILGTRKNELLSARWEHVDFGRQALVIPETKSGHPYRKPLTVMAVAILQSLPSRGSSEWLFPSLRPTRCRVGHMTGAQQAWARIRKAAGITDKNAVIHTLRHTAGSWLAMDGNSGPIIQKALNHAQLKTTEGYIHLDLDPVRLALEHSTAQMPFFLTPAESRADDIYSVLAANLVSDTDTIEVSLSEVAA